MSRFEYDGEEGMPWDLWQATVSRALGGRSGQEALAAMEGALLALPEPVLIEGHLASQGAVCAVGALVAHRRAAEQGVDLAAVIEAMSAGIACWCGHSREKHEENVCLGTGWIDNRSCSCQSYDPESEDIYETANAGMRVGLTSTVAYHLAYLNDEQFGSASPEDRYAQMLGWVRRAQGKEAVAA